jgi:ProP effector
MTDTTTPTPRAKRPRPAQRTRPAGPPQPQQQRTREVHPVLEKLFELYPKMFGAQFLPLKLGAFQDLLAENPEAFKRDELKVALGLHARSTRYLECVAAGHPRHNLQGEPVEPVAPEHVHHAIMEVFRRRQARSKEDLRPKVIARLVAAIEASGLSREDYAERTRTQDEAANALLDEAFAEIAVQTAKREALMRAFEASGKTVEQFAEMYGMAPTDVAQAVERTRQAGAAQPQ